MKIYEKGSSSKVRHGFIEKNTAIFNENYMNEYARIFLLFSSSYLIP